jgi:hypothetical protein
MLSSRTFSLSCIGSPQLHASVRAYKRSIHQNLLPCCSPPCLLKIHVVHEAQHAACKLWAKKVGESLTRVYFGNFNSVLLLLKQAMGTSRQLRVATEAACRLLHKRCSNISHTASDNVLGNRIAPILSWFGTGALEETIDKKLSKEHIVQPWMGAESVNWIESNDLASAKKLRAELPYYHHHVQHHLSAPNQYTTSSSNLTPSFWQHNAPVQALAHISSSIFASTPGNRLYSTRNSPSGTGSKDDDEEGADGEYVEESGEWDDSAPLYETILAEVVDEGRVGLITINRPDKLNALSAQVMDELQDALQEFDMEPTVKVRKCLLLLLF